LPEGTGRVLLGFGAGVDRAIDICAYPLGGELPGGPLPGAVTARPVQTREDVADYERASCAAWGYRQPSDADVDRAFAGLTAGYFVGYWEETPASAGGYTIAGEVARLWGAAVVPAFRGRGLYRALVRARLAQAGYQQYEVSAYARAGARCCLAWTCAMRPTICRAVCGVACAPCVRAC